MANYSSFEGNLIYREEKLPDMCLSSIEIGRRTYEFYHQYVLKDKNKEKNIIFDKLENVQNQIEKSLEELDYKEAWTAWNGKTTLSSATKGSSNVLYLRGIGNSVITGSINYRWLLTGSDIRCIGNIENLLDYATVEAGNHPTMASYCYFAYMFSGTAITQAPALPATTLATTCYDNMFSGTAITQAPALPATTLAEYCYDDMFKGCKSLTQAPALPATTLANNCYASMFSGCTSLTQAPALPATTLADYCYHGMFWNCLKIKLSSTQTGEYTQEYRIPSSGTGTTGTNSYALKDMFRYTGGTFKGTPEINTTYYLSNTNTVVS